MLTIRDPEGQLDGEIITAYMWHLVRNNESKIAFLHPSYTANFYAPNETVLDTIKTNNNAYPARNFLRGEANFDVLLIPFHVRQSGEWLGGEHWMLGTYNKQGAGY